MTSTLEEGREKADERNTDLLKTVFLFQKEIEEARFSSLSPVCKILFL